MNIFHLLHQSAIRWPNGPAVFEDEALVATYGQLHARCLAIARRLTRVCGLRHGDRVGIFAPNSAAVIEIMWAAWAAELTVVPINAKLHAKEVAYILHDSRARLCLTAQDRVDEVQGAAFMAGAEVAVADIASDYEGWRVSPYTGAHGDASADIAWLFYTSGTTGRPKGVKLLHENLRQMILNFRAHVDQMGPNACQIHFSPLSHGSGMYMLAHVQAGAANVVPIRRKFVTDDLEALLFTHRDVLMFCAPTMVRRLIDQPELSQSALASLRTIVCGGGPMYVADLIEAHRRFGGKFVQIYGQGECPMTITYLSRAEIDSAILAKVEATLGSVGFPFAGVEVRIVDGLGSDLPSGHLGEVLVRGPVVMQGYWGDPKSTEQTVQAGWLRTGDVGVIDDSGRLILRDREKDLIISGGLNIYPREVEEILIRHPGVREAAVVGQHDSQWGEIVVAFVAMHRGHASASTELDALCLDNIARYKRPKAYCFLPDLPKNSYGKILKRELRERLHMRSTDPNAPRVHNIEQS